MEKIPYQGGIMGDRTLRFVFTCCHTRQRKPPATTGVLFYHFTSSRGSIKGCW